MAGILVQVTGSVWEERCKCLQAQYLNACLELATQQIWEI